MALHYEKEHSNYKFSNIASEVDESFRINQRQNNKVTSSTSIKPVKKPKNNLVFWPCSVCGNTFSNFQRYQKHLKTTHRVTDQQVLVDMEALKSVTSLNEYNQTSKK